MSTYSPTRECYRDEMLVAERWPEQGQSPRSISVSDLPLDGEEKVIGLTRTWLP